MRTEIFKVYVGPDGIVWIAQYKPIAHDVDGSSAAAFDDIATIAADLRVKATITDYDGDSSSAVSDVALRIEFQDDGPTATAEASQNVPEGGAPITGTLDFVAGADGASVTHINGTPLNFGGDGFSQSIAIAHGAIKVKADGSYVFTPQADDVYLTGGPVSGTYHGQGRRRRHATAGFSFTVLDDVDPTVVTLDDVAVVEGTARRPITASVNNLPQSASR